MLKGLILLFVLAFTVLNVLIDRTKNCSCEELDEQNCMAFQRACLWINQTCIHPKPQDITNELICARKLFCWSKEKQQCDEITDCSQCENNYLCPYYCRNYEMYIGYRKDVCISPAIGKQNCPTACVKNDQINYCALTKDGKCIYKDEYYTCEERTQLNYYCGDFCKDVNGTCQPKQCADLSKGNCRENIPINRTHEILCEFKNQTCQEMNEVPEIFEERKENSTCFTNANQTKWVNDTCYQCQNLVTYRLKLGQYLLLENQTIDTTATGNSSQSVNSSANANSTTANSTSGNGQTTNSNDSTTNQQTNSIGASQQNFGISQQLLIILIIILN